MSFWQVLRQICCTDILFVFFGLSRQQNRLNNKPGLSRLSDLMYPQEGRNIATQSFYNSSSVYYKINHCNTCEGRFRRFTE